MTKTINELKCIFPFCQSVYRTTERVRPDATYFCRLHAITWYGDFFQEYQFDKDLRRAGKPLGTDHIHRQGQQLDTEEEREAWASIQELSREKESDE